MRERYHNSLAHAKGNSLLESLNIQFLRDKFTVYLINFSGIKGAFSMRSFVCACSEIYTRKM